MNAHATYCMTLMLSFLYIVSYGSQIIKLLNNSFEEIPQKHFGINWAKYETSQSLGSYDEILNSINIKSCTI